MAFSGVDQLLFTGSCLLYGLLSSPSIYIYVISLSYPAVVMIMIIMINDDNRG